VAPIDRSAVAIGKALGGATQAMLQGLILLAFGLVALFFAILNFRVRD
jgi:hypothetical protein